MNTRKINTVRDWINKEIEKLNESRQEYLSKLYNLEGAFNYFSYIKDMTGYKLTCNNDSSEIGKRMNGKEFLEYLEFTNDVIKRLGDKE